MVSRWDLLTSMNPPDQDQLWFFSSKSWIHNQIVQWTGWKSEVEIMHAQLKSNSRWLCAYHDRPLCPYNVKNGKHVNSGIFARDVFPWKVLQKWNPHKIEKSLIQVNHAPGESLIYNIANMSFNVIRKQNLVKISEFRYM